MTGNVGKTLKDTSRKQMQAHPKGRLRCRAMSTKRCSISDFHPDVWNLHSKSLLCENKLLHGVNMVLPYWKHLMSSPSRTNSSLPVLTAILARWAQMWHSLHLKCERRLMNVVGRSNASNRSWILFLDEWLSCRRSYLHGMHAINRETHEAFNGKCAVFSLINAYEYMKIPSLLCCCALTQ